MNSTHVFTLLYFGAILAEILIRAPYRRQTRKNELADNRFDARERFYLTLLLISMFVAPLVYTVTPWLNFANYSLPAWSGWLGVLLLAMAVEHCPGIVAAELDRRPDRTGSICAILPAARSPGGADDA